MKAVGNAVGNAAKVCTNAVNSCIEAGQEAAYVAHLAGQVAGPLWKGAQMAFNPDNTPGVLGMAKTVVNGARVMHLASEDRWDELHRKFGHGPTFDLDGGEKARQHPKRAAGQDTLRARAEILSRLLARQLLEDAYLD
ncbi:uncharacterized protein FIBRA_00198 [Fibroporia radiculosa]|uniref:Uncharacterized protein n=1 Tax=Fibroporia radiculosa TaxID=599839 RepID=J7S5T1_9APHY|nr:uncharacterized protein FIBRA_00198 [Fibroporia radiculosa]CCL98204.1 predicted protein [Fibroporia radiculosa]